MENSENTAPAYMRIRQYAVDLIYKEPERELRFPSERGLCAMFKVTRPTVRRALGDLIKEGYLIIHPGLGTFTNPKKAKIFRYGRKPFSAAVIIGDGKTVFYSSFHAGILGGIFSAVSRAGGLVRIPNIISTDGDIINEVKRLNVDGLIWISPPDTSPVKRLSAAGIHVISVNRGCKDSKINYCGFDFRANGKLIADYFLDRGIQDVVFAVKSEQEYETETYAGFTEAYQSRGLEYNKCLALTDLDSVGSDIQKMLRFGVKFTGLYTDGIYFPETVETLRKNNLNPGAEVKLLTQQNALAFCPDVHCDAIALPMFETGERASDALLSLFEGETAKRVLLRLPGKIITRSQK